jgi:hypothetical protein
MAHFARVENNIVQEVIAIDNKDCGGGDFPSSEVVGQDFIRSLGIQGQWLQVSYSESFRHRFPSKGFIYDHTSDIFVSYQPYPSWILNDQHEWEAPKPYPDDGVTYKWDEILEDWVDLDFVPPGIIESLNLKEPEKSE